MIHMIFFAPYPEILPVIEQVFRERPDRHEISYQVILDTFNNRLESVEADAVIARGFTAHTMKKMEIPCAELKTSGYDVIAAIDKCLRMVPAKKIAIVGAFNMIYGSDSISSIYQDVTLTCYSIDDETMLEASVLQAVRDENTAIVGGYSTVMIADKYQVPSVMIESGKEAVNNAIAEAKSAAQIAIHEREKSNEIANIMNYSFHGIISTDRTGFITLANTYCYSLMRNLKSSVIGRHIRELFPDIPIDAVIGSSIKVLSELHIYDELPLLVNCVPIVGDHDNAGCVLTFQNIAQIQAEEGKIRKKMHQGGFKAKYHFSDILYQDPTMYSLIQDAIHFSYSDSNILIHGETGTGKELFAQSIHHTSRRRDNPFVAINCSALPENLLESELFGYVEGAFTGASKGGKMGFFEIAHKGTIFLDEIGDISPKLQSRLLRVLQEREIIRLGNDTVIPIDVRVLSATNRNLKDEVEKGNFRQDLLYRLDVLEINIPPLRDRLQDVCYLLDRFIQFEHERTGCVLTAITPDGKALLKDYSWPGNIREMRNFCERICILCQEREAGISDCIRALPEIRKAGLSVPGTREFKAEKKAALLPEAERQAIIDALLMFHHNRSETARYLGIDKSTLWRKRKKYGI